MNAIIPISRDSFDGAFTTSEKGFRIVAQHHKALIVEFDDVPEGIDWIGPGQQLYCQIQHDLATFEVVRRATFRDRKMFRIPEGIEDENIPQCCGRPMHFVQQFEDGELMDERPADAQEWWQELVVFYVFACSRCLECKAVALEY